jgi:hypothetical protein
MKLLLDAIYRSPTARRFLEEARELRICEQDYHRLVRWLVRTYGSPEQVARLDRVLPEARPWPSSVDRAKRKRVRGKY